MRIHASSFCVWCIYSEEEWVKEVIRRTGYVEFRVFNVAAEFEADLHAVLALSYRHEVRVRVNVFVELLRITIVGTEAERAIIETNSRHAALGGGNGREAACVASFEFIDYRWREYVGIAELSV